MTRRAYVFHFNLSQSESKITQSESKTIYSIISGPEISRKAILQDAIDKKFIIEPGEYFVATPEPGFVNATRFKVEEITQPKLRIV